MEKIEVKKVGMRISLDFHIFMFLSLQVKRIEHMKRLASTSSLYSKEYRVGHFSNAKINLASPFYVSTEPAKYLSRTLAQRQKLQFLIISSNHLFANPNSPDIHMDCGSHIERRNSKHISEMLEIDADQFANLIEIFCINQGYFLDELIATQRLILGEKEKVDSLNSLVEFLQMSWPVYFGYQPIKRELHPFTLSPDSNTHVNNTRHGNLKNLFKITKRHELLFGRDREYYDFIMNPLEEGYYFAELNNKIKIHKTKLYLRLDALDKHEVLKQSPMSKIKKQLNNLLPVIASERIKDSRVVLSFSEGRDLTSAIVDESGTHVLLNPLKAKKIAMKTNELFNVDFYKKDEVKIETLTAMPFEAVQDPYKPQTFSFKLVNEKISFTDLPMSCLNTLAVPCIRIHTTKDRAQIGDIQGLLAFAYASQKMYEKFGCSYYIEIVPFKTEAFESKHFWFTLRIMPSWVLTDNALFSPSSEFHAPALTCTCIEVSNVTWSDLKSYMGIFGVNGDVVPSQDVGEVKLPRAIEPKVCSLFRGEMLLNEFSVNLPKNFSSQVDIDKITEALNAFEIDFDYYLNSQIFEI